MSAERETLSERFGEWTLSFRRDDISVGDWPAIVEVSRDGAVRARVSVPAHREGGGDTTPVLRDAARQWIVDYESRPHFGDTGAPG